MNILHINKFHYMRGGSEAVYFRTADILESHGHRSLFFSMHHPENIPCETSNFFMPYVDLANGNGLMKQIKDACRVLYSFEARKRLSQLLDKHPVDIAHLHNITRYISPSIIHELKKRKIPMVMTLHCYDLVCASYRMMVDGRPCEACSGRKIFNIIQKKCIDGSFKKSVLATLEMYLHHKVLDIYSNVDVFISPSLFLKNKLIEMGFKKEIVHVPNFIDTRRFEQINDEKLNSPENSIVYSGRLSHEKGLWTLLEAAKNIDPEIEIKLIGDGYLRNSMEEKVKKEGIHNVRFLGYLKGNELYHEIKKSNAVVLPSEYYENNPMSVLEAFALGKPVIGARIGGIPELVRDNETGLTFEAGNANDLAEKIKYVLDRPDKCVDMGNNARSFVEQNLNDKKYYAKLINIYKNILHNEV